MKMVQYHPMVRLVALVAFFFSVQVAQASSDYALQSHVWVQQSAEYQALCIQAYNLATDRLRQIVNGESASTLKPSEHPETSKKLAIVTDIDETVLLNLKSLMTSVRDEQPFDPSVFHEWVLKESAPAIPGAVAFFREAKRLGVEIFYISNRMAASEVEPTARNLLKAGLPVKSVDHILFKTDTSSKDARRAQVSKDYEIVLFLGDNLGDFSGLYDGVNSESRKAQVAQDQDSFGRKWIVLPNPMYGEWEKVFLRFDYPQASSSTASAPNAKQDPTAVYRWWVQNQDLPK